MRKNEGVQLLKRLLIAKQNQIQDKSFDNFGNVSFGIKEHIDIPDIKYDPRIGIFGLNVSISLSRLGFNIRFKRNIKKFAVNTKFHLMKEKNLRFKNLV